MNWAAKFASKSRQTAVEADYSAHAEEAARLYTEAGTPQGPAWGNLGEGTRGVWLYKAHLKSIGVTDWWSYKPTLP